MSPAVLSEQPQAAHFLKGEKQAGLEDNTAIGPEPLEGQGVTTTV